MKRAWKYLAFIISMAGMVACEEEIDVDIPSNANTLVVEAYINDRDPRLTYVLLSRSTDYFNGSTGFAGVRNADIYITEGQVNGTDTSWDISTRTRLNEVRPDTSPGFYRASHLLGRQGFIYQLEVQAGNEKVWGITSIPALVPLDSMTYVNKSSGGESKVRVTLHFNEPVATNNNYRVVYRTGSDSLINTWGFQSGTITFSDDFINGVYRRLDMFNSFEPGDTLNLWFTSIDRSSYNFWESFNDARRNGGPFATPVLVKSNVTGGIGCFTGQAMMYRRLLIRK